MMKIVFISGVRFGLDLLRFILDNKWKVSAVFSYADSKKKNYSDYASFDEITRKYKIKHVKVQNINDKENVKELKSINPDLILVMGWSQILKREILTIPRIGIIGSHPTMLPKYRGRAPIPWSIIKGLKESALTFFYMKEGTDDGDILDQRKFKISSNDDATSLYEKITNLGKIMLLKNLQLLQNGKENRVAQDESKFLEYWPKRTPEDGKIDWLKPGQEIHALIRATTHPYPGAFSFFNALKLKIWKAKYVDETSLGAGKIGEINDEGVKVGTGKGNILLQRVSLDGDEETFATKIFSEDDRDSILG
ncbi:MAG: methionyl-tRNA formyltransferase [Nitrosopumilaceae archaeon]